MQRVVLLQRRRRRQIALDRVVKRGNVRGALNRGVAAQRHDAGAGPADVAEQQLQQRAGADDLDAVGVLRPGDRIGERSRPFGARVRQNGLGDLEKSFFGTAGGFLDHLRRVAGEMPLDDLENAARVLQRLVLHRRRPYQRSYQRCESFPGLSSTFAAGAARLRALTVPSCRRVRW